MSTSRYQIHAQQRAKLGGRSSRKLRREGQIPAVLYGIDQKPLHLQLNSREFAQQFRHVSENSIIDLHYDGQVYQVLVKDYSLDVIRSQLLHIDFYHVVAGRMLKTHVPIRCQGSPVGAKMGGLIEHNTNELLVECLPKDLPETIEVDISGLNLGQSIHVRDLKIAQEVHILTSEEQLVVHIAIPRGVSADEEETEDTAAAS